MKQGRLVIIVKRDNNIHKVYVVRHDPRVTPNDIEFEYNRLRKEYLEREVPDILKKIITYVNVDYIMEKLRQKFNLKFEKVTAFIEVEG